MEFRTAIVGCGAIAPIHAEALQDCKYASLAVMMDTDSDRVKHMANSYGCEAESNYSKLLERKDIQVIHICTPHYLHASMTIEALKAGKHVLVEKPVALTLEDAYAMQMVADQHGVQVGVVYQNRYNPSSQMIKAYLEEETLGQLLGMRAILTWKRDEAYYRTADWRGKWKTEGGALLINQAIHTLDLFQWYGGEPIEIKGVAANHTLEGVIEAEDTAHAVMTFGSGVRGIFFGTNAHVVSSPIQMDIYCEQGTLRLNNNHLYLDQDGSETLLCDPPVPPSKGKIAWGVSHAHCIDDFYKHLVHGKIYPIDAAEAAKSLRMVLNIAGFSCLFDILSVLSEQESKKISARVSSARKQKARRGQWGGEPPIGYKVNQTSKKLEVDPESKEVPTTVQSVSLTNDHLQIKYNYDFSF